MKEELKGIIDTRQILADKRNEIRQKDYKDKKPIYDAKVVRFSKAKTLLKSPTVAQGSIKPNWETAFETGGPL